MFVWVHHCRLIILERQALCILYIFPALILAQEIRLGGGIYCFNGFTVITVFGWLTASTNMLHYFMHSNTRKQL